jgi:hypothetical protein
MTHYDYMYWMMRYGMISEKTWVDYCYSIANEVIWNEDTIAIFKRMKFN